MQVDRSIDAYWYTSTLSGKTMIMIKQILKIAVALLFVLCLAIAGHGTDRVLTKVRVPVGMVSRFIHGENLAYIQITAQRSVWQGRKLFVENLAGRVIAQVTLRDDVDPNERNQIGVITFLDDPEVGSQPIRMGYTIIVQQEKITWYPQPERRKEPFVKTELVQNYSSRKILPVDRREMVLIPRGKFVMGSNLRFENEFPERIVYVNDFYIDKFEVSNQEFLQFLREVQDSTLMYYQKKIGSPEFSRLPFAEASYTQARSYCRWAGKRLPTEEQWEKAARGFGLRKEKSADGRFHFVKEPKLYPWGDEYRSGMCNGNLKSGTTIAVDAMPQGQSPFGVFHMVGNVMEWTRSWYLPYPESHALDRDFGKIFRVLRGGDYSSKVLDLTATRRRSGGYPSLARDHRGGIRCVYEVIHGREEGP